MTKNPDSIPHIVWPAETLRQAEREAADSLGLTLFELMRRAGEAAFQLARSLYPASQHWLILCGHGNNGGDGYVVARLAQAQGIAVTLLALESDKPLPEEAQAAREEWLNAGGVIHAADSGWPDDISLIIDGLLGTGLHSAPRANVAGLIELANAYPAPVIALDIPSGLNAQTGATPGAVIHAAHTLTFIALKPGLLTGNARDVVGRLHHHALGLERWLAGQNTAIRRFSAGQLAGWLPPRRPTSHKGSHGRLVIIGGDRGTAGAIRMAGEAALRAGAGLVRVLTRAENIAGIVTARPELMVHELNDDSLTESTGGQMSWRLAPVLGKASGGKRRCGR